MILLGIETSCDETSAAVLKTNGSKIKLLSNVVSSSADLHAKTGGIIPEIAAREQTKVIIPVIKKALEDAKLDFYDPKIDAIALTVGPGLIGSLIVGVETAKSLSAVWNIPIIPVNHLFGHLYANFIDQNKEIKFPALGLIVSGGHTDLILIKKHNSIKWIGGTRDDAAGEAFDKVGRMLNLPYPSGPLIEKLASEGDPKKIKLPKPMIGSGNFDFSFSGLKSAAFREIQKNELTDGFTRDICASLQKSIVDVLVRKTVDAAIKNSVKSILLGGGVAANSELRKQLEEGVKKSGRKIDLFVPPKYLCTDNGAMIAAAAVFNKTGISKDEINADPGLYF